MLAVAGVLEKLEPDAHIALEQRYSPPAPPKPRVRRPRTPQEREDRRLLIARMAAAG